MSEGKQNGQMRRDSVHVYYDCWHLKVWNKIFEKEDTSSSLYKVVPMVASSPLWLFRLKLITLKLKNLVPLSQD